MSGNKLFDNTEKAFALKTDAALERAYALFRLISSESLVKIGTNLTKLALNLHLPVEGLIRATVFDHFCGGVSEQDAMNVVTSLDSVGVCSVLDYSVEGKEEQSQFDATRDKVLSLIEFSKDKSTMPFAVFKPTGLGRFKIWEAWAQGTLKGPLGEEWNRVTQRYDDLARAAQSSDLRLLIDAEESWMQDGADALCTQMMFRYNKETPVVFNTLQCYRHDRLDYLKELHLQAKAKGVKLGFKVVRGAYMEKENERAKERGYPSPICRDKNHTDEVFDTVVSYILQNLDDISLFIGSHNEESTLKALDLMTKLGIDQNDSRVWFGQLYGMSDHITYNLSNQGYNAAKYIPFGPVKDVMPYLIRRAEENTSVSGQTSRELELLKKELKRRREARG
ncbi:MAG: proline dehydrogenase family protein [Flavobacteriaceae bacterium]|jgi:proline dehydrogenase